MPDLSHEAQTMAPRTGIPAKLGQTRSERSKAIQVYLQLMPGPFQVYLMLLPRPFQVYLMLLPEVAMMSQQAIGPRSG